MAAEYIEAPVPVDPEELEIGAHETIQTAFPEWQPSEANLDSWIIRAVAHIAAGIGEDATDVLRSVFRYYGAYVIGLPPLEAEPASGDTTWTLIDTDGHTIPAGTVVGFDSDGTLIEFQTVEDTVVAPGESTVSGVGVVALDAGADGNGVTGDGTLIDPIDWVQTVTLDSATSGGEDEESDDEYFSRLVAELRILSPRPILPDDFAVLAKRISGVERATAINLYNPDDGTYGNERTVTVVVADADGQPLSSVVKAELAEYLEAMREVNFVVHIADPTYTTVDVAFTAVTWPSWDADAVEAEAEAAVESYLSPATFGQIDYTESDDWIIDTKIRLFEVAQVINNVQGVHYVTALTINGAAADLSLIGVAPLPEAGTISGNVVNP